MAFNQHRQIFVAILLLSLSSLGAALYCYSCSESITTGICRDENGKHSPTMKCKSNEVCVSHLLEATNQIGDLLRAQNEDTEKVLKLCVKKDYCGTASFLELGGLKTKNCTLCDKDYCNSASIAVPAIVSFLGLIIQFFL